MKTNRFALLAILTFLGAASANAEVSLLPTGVIEMIPTSMSDDTSIVVGTGTSACRTSITRKPAVRSSSVTAASAVCPQSRVTGRPLLDAMINSDGKWNAAQWLGGTSWLDLGTVDGRSSLRLFLSGA